MHAHIYCLNIANVFSTNYRRDTEVVHIKSDIAPAVALTDSVSAHNDEGDDQYDNFGNFIGDKSKNLVLIIHTQNE